MKKLRINKKISIFGLMGLLICAVVLAVLFKTPIPQKIASFSASILGVSGEESCTDSDGGENHYLKGYIIYKGIRSDDQCNPGPNTTENTLLEYYCTGNPQEPAWGIKYECFYGCKDGACLKEPLEEKCLDGTLYAHCSEDRPKYCDNGSLVDRCDLCGCSDNLTCQDNVCVELVKKCSDGTLHNQCSRFKPWFCENGALIKKCQKCGCSNIEEVCQEDGRCSKQKHSLRVGIIEFAPEDVKYGDLYFCYDLTIGYYLQTLEEYCTNIIEKHSFLEIFNNPDGQFEFKNLRKVDEDNNPHSAFYVKDFYERETERFALSETPISEVEVKGPYTLHEDPPTRSRTVGSVGEVISFFQNKVEELGLDLSQYDSIVYVYFNDQGLSHRNYPGFLGFTSGKGIYTSLETQRVIGDDAVEGIVHEMGHELGAFDRYIAPCPRGSYTSCCMDPEGIPEPNKIPKYPQEKACLMCGNMALTAEGEEQNVNLNRTVICDETALEIGWKPWQETTTRDRLLRVEGRFEVYYLTEFGTVRHIPSPEVFLSYGFKWEDIVVISQAELNRHPINDLIRLKNGIKVYKLIGGMKQWIKNAETFNILKYDWNKIASVNQTEFDYYPEQEVPIDFTQ